MSASSSSSGSTAPGPAKVRQVQREYSPETIPIKIGDNLYMCSAKNIIIGIDAASGREECRYDPIVADDSLPYDASCRGVSCYATPNAPTDQACANRIIEGTLDGRLIAVDAADGKPCADFGRNGEVNLLKGIGKVVPAWYGRQVIAMFAGGHHFHADPGRGLSDGLCAAGSKGHQLVQRQMSELQVNPSACGAFGAHVRCR
jgi:glucose dehydrogenase